MDETSKPDFYNDIKEKEAIIFNQRRNLLKEIMINSNSCSTQMNGGILVMEINYGLGRIKKLLLYMGRYKS